MRTHLLPLVPLVLLSPLLLAACASLGTLRPAAPPRDDSVVYHAFVRGERFLPLVAPEAPWQQFADDAASIAAEPGALHLASLPSQRVWASPLLPVAPLNGAAADQIEELTWEATVDLDARFFVVVELRFAGEPGALLVQATPFDVQVFQDTERPGGGTSDSVSRLVGDGAPHFWRVRLLPDRTELRHDGSAVWALPGRRFLSRVAFGETRSDSLHGGRMTLRDLVYVRRPA
jgi:hypothetical protein